MQTVKKGDILIALTEDGNVDTYIVDTRPPGPYAEREFEYVLRSTVTGKVQAITLNGAVDYTTIPVDNWHSRHNTCISDYAKWAHTGHSVVEHKPVPQSTFELRKGW